MRYLELPQLARLNTTLARIDADDGSRITGRAEAFSAKQASSDRKLWRHLEDKWETTWRDADLGDGSDTGVSNNAQNDLPPSSPGQNTAMSHAVVAGIPLKHVYVMIATMNQVFPDYDFRYLLLFPLSILTPASLQKHTKTRNSDIDPKCFQKKTSLPQIMQHVTSSIQNSGITKNMHVLLEFSRNVWDAIDAAIDLQDCVIYTFDPEEDDYIDNPFSLDNGCMYKFFYIFLLTIN